MNYKENAEIVKKYLDEDDWNYDMDDRGNAIVFRGRVGVSKSVFSVFYFLVAVEDEVVQNFVSLPISARDKLAEVAEFITRVNYPLKYGRMDMDYGDGEVRYHICVPIEAVKTVPKETLELVMKMPNTVLTKYGKGIADIIFKDVDAKTAYEECEA